MLAIDAADLEKTYTGEGAPVTVFRGLSFRIEEGAFAAIMGPSGSGKSTLLHLLGAIDRPNTGRVQVLGRDLAQMAPRERARFRNENIGFVFQFHHLLPEFTAEENVAFPHRIAGVSPGESRRLAGELLERLGLGERRGHLSRALSGGEQQRVAIARALARGPRVLLADEPTGNLDAAAAESVFDLLAREHKERGMTSVLVTHNPELARRCDTIYTMSREGISPEVGYPGRG
ncbi:MAG TPA: ABC transporter ATP-binding protein [Thermoanaerobaculia bacterium]|jgi:ABC-type lipoprotein export system ATPase subunit